MPGPLPQHNEAWEPAPPPPRPVEQRKPRNEEMAGGRAVADRFPPEPDARLVTATLRERDRNLVGDRLSEARPGTLTHTYIWKWKVVDERRFPAGATSSLPSSSSTRRGRKKKEEGSAPPDVPPQKPLPNGHSHPSPNERRNENGQSTGF